VDKEITVGQAVLAQNAYGDWIPKKALSGLQIPARGMPFVLVCDPENWQKPPSERGAVGWPAKYLKRA
jgi:hypothetical protein